MCVAAQNCEKFAKITFWDFMSFKVIYVCTPGKVVSSTFYDTQQVCVYLQPFSRYTSQ